MCLVAVCYINDNTNETPILVLISGALPAFLAGYIVAYFRMKSLDGRKIVVEIDEDVTSDAANSNHQETNNFISSTGYVCDVEFKSEYQVELYTRFLLE